MTAVLVPADHRDDWPCDRPCPACDAPTGPVQLLPAGADRDEWLAARRAGIGASEISAVMGLSPWESPFSLYWRKVNGWEIDASDEMNTGTLLEPVIADWWAEHCDPLENLAVRLAGLFASGTRPWQIATPDRLVGWVCPYCVGQDLCCHQYAAEQLAVLECKWVAYSWDGWGEPDTDEIPVYYRAQVQWQCDVMDVDAWYLAALGPGGFRQYHGRRDEKDLAVMREHGRRFMARLAAGDPPPIDEHTATVSTLRRLHPAIDDTEVDVPDAVAAGYRRACRMQHTAERVKKRYEAQLRAAMGRARKATNGGVFVASRSVYDVAEHSVRAHTVDRLNPARGAKK